MKDGRGRLLTYYLDECTRGIDDLEDEGKDGRRMPKKEYLGIT